MSNIYHCCVQKTGSQWIKAILADELVLAKTGMTIYIYHRHLPNQMDPRKLTERTFTEPFPVNCILSPLYMDYKSYLSIPKPDFYRTFCIIRDPRDIIISWYFSVKYSHPPMGKISQHREFLNQTSLTEGLIYCITYLKDYGLFAALQSWVSESAGDVLVKLFRFEELINSEQQFSLLTQLFSHCQFQLSRPEILYLMEKYSFTEMQHNSQKQASENQVVSHYRKGVPGDWQNYFNKDVNTAFVTHLGNIVEALGYS